MISRSLIEPQKSASAADLLSSIGRTPLIRLRRVTGELAKGIEVYAKAEHLNPGGSVKDRAALAYRVTLCLPKNASRERKHMLRIYGAELIETDPEQATDGAQLRARALAEAEPENYFYPDQYNNDA